jgi:hypothetical protein
MGGEAARKLVGGEQRGGAALGHALAGRSELRPTRKGGRAPIVAPGRAGGVAPGQAVAHPDESAAKPLRPLLLEHHSEILSISVP